MTRILGALLALLLVGWGLSASAEWDNLGSRPKAGQSLWANKPNLFGGQQYSQVTTQTGTTYTLVAADCGTMIQFTSGSAITLTLPNSLRPGCNVSIEQDGAGQITPTAASGASLHNKSSFTKTSGQYAVIGVAVWSNAGGQAAEWILIGDGA